MTLIAGAVKKSELETRVKELEAENARLKMRLRNHESKCPHMPGNRAYKCARCGEWVPAWEDLV